MDSHPACRRPHKFPAHVLKEPRSRPQRLPPCPDVSVEVSRSFWQLVFVSSTPREREFSNRLASWPEPLQRGEPHILAARFGFVNTSLRGSFRTPHRSAEAFLVSEPPSIGDFRKTASTS